MSHPITLHLLTVASLLAARVAMAAPPPAATGYDPLQTFAPFQYPQSANAFRTSTGRPRLRYWQNRADYHFKATLDPATRKLVGEETITYTNHSPNDLDVLWLQLEQNRYRKDARGAFGGDTFPTEFTDGEDITAVAVEGTDGKFQNAEWLVSDTRMQVRLPQPLKAHNGKLRVHIVYRYIVPAEFGDRTDVNPSKNGDNCEIAQWFPRMCEYDDLRGWTTDPYLNNEFYLEYGDYDYSVTVPRDMIVVESGELLNPHDVLTKFEMERLGRARHSDATVMIRSPEEANDLAARPKQSGTSTWHFRIRNSRDAVFGTSRRRMCGMPRASICRAVSMHSRNLRTRSKARERTRWVVLWST